MKICLDEPNICIPMTNYIKQKCKDNNITKNTYNGNSIEISNSSDKSTKIKYNSNMTTSSASITFKNDTTSLITTIYGPNESKLKFKTRSEYCYVEIISIFNHEVTKERQESFNFYLKSFCESVIKLDEYPRCLITIIVNVMNYSNDIELNSHTLNSLMITLSLSGLDLKTNAISICLDLNSLHNDKVDKVKDKTNNNMISFVLDSNDSNNVLNVDSNNPINIEEYDNYLSLALSKYDEENKKNKLLLISQRLS